MFGGILGSMIVTQHPRDLKTLFLRFSRHFQFDFEISVLIIFKFWIWKFLLDHFDGPQLFFRGRISLENARNGVFRSRRYCFKKIPWKNIIFSQSYSLRHLCSFFLQKSSLGLVFTSSSRGAIHILYITLVGLFESLYELRPTFCDP